jgi:hypothetical protein
MYASQWFITLFCSNFPVDFAARVLDLFLIHGWSIIFSISIALHKLHEQQLLKLKFEDILGHYQRLPLQEDFSTSEIITLAMEIKISNAELKVCGVSNIFVCCSLLSAPYLKLHPH